MANVEWANPEECTGKRALRSCASGMPRICFSCVKSLNLHSTTFMLMHDHGKAGYSKGSSMPPETHFHFFVFWAGLIRYLSNTRYRQRASQNRNKAEGWSGRKKLLSPNQCTGSDVYLYSHSRAISQYLRQRGTGNTVRRLEGGAWGEITCMRRLTSSSAVKASRSVTRFRVVHGRIKLKLRMIQQVFLSVDTYRIILPASRKNELSEALLGTSFCKAQHSSSISKDLDENMTRTGN